MGTRGLTCIYANGNYVVIKYHQRDCYPEEEDNGYYPTKFLVKFDFHSLPDEKTFINTLNFSN